MSVSEEASPPPPRTRQSGCGGSAETVPCSREGCAYVSGRGCEVSERAWRGPALPGALMRVQWRVAAGRLAREEGGSGGSWGARTPRPMF